MFVLYITFIYICEDLYIFSLDGENKTLFFSKHQTKKKRKILAKHTLPSPSLGETPHGQKYEKDLHVVNKRTVSYSAKTKGQTSLKKPISTFFSILM